MSQEDVLKIIEKRTKRNPISAREIAKKLKKKVHRELERLRHFNEVNYETVCRRIPENNNRRVFLTVYWRKNGRI